MHRIPQEMSNNPSLASPRQAWPASPAAIICFVSVCQSGLPRQLGGRDSFWGSLHNSQKPPPSKLLQYYVTLLKDNTFRSSEEIF